MSEFDTLPNWPSGLSCGAYRPYKDFALAINLDDNGTRYPTTIKWSDIVLANQPPASWDETDPTTSSGERPLTQATSELVDGWPLGDDFLIYGYKEVFKMTHIGGKFVMRTQVVHTDRGIMSTDCMVEDSGKHFVFGLDDIYVTDGVSAKSIIESRNHEKVFRSLDYSMSDNCFVTKDPSLPLIYFCYVSSESGNAFTGSGNCNTAAVYNTQNDTWSFMDLPNVVSAARSTLNKTLTYDQANLTYKEIGSLYADQEDGGATALSMICQSDANLGLSEAKLLGVDLADLGSLSFPTDSEAATPAYVERVGYDLDNANIPLREYKVMKTLYPQLEAFQGVNFQVSVGSSLVPSSIPTWKVTKQFDVLKDYKVDAFAGGRYLSLRVELEEQNDFSFPAFDVEVENIGGM
jgi:hypothetical protein